MKKTIIAFTCIASLLGSALANAAIYKIDFTATGFTPTSYFSTPAPLDPVIGSIVLTTMSSDSPLTSIDMIDLTIGSHSYLPDEIDVVNVGANSYLFGGRVSGVNTIKSGTNDFYLYAVVGQTSFMSYTVSGVEGIWNSATVATTFTEQAASVPEPSGLALLLAGFAGFGALRLRRRA